MGKRIAASLFSVFLLLSLSAQGWAWYDFSQSRTSCFSGHVDRTEDMEEPLAAEGALIPSVRAAPTASQSSNGENHGVLFKPAQRFGCFIGSLLYVCKANFVKEGGNT